MESRLRVNIEDINSEDIEDEEEKSRANFKTQMGFLHLRRKNKKNCERIIYNKKGMVMSD